MEQASDDVRRIEDEIMEDTIADIANFRRERHDRQRQAVQS